MVLDIVKLGGDGVLLADARGERLVAPAPIEVLCGLGAGDAFGGALCHGLLSRLGARARRLLRQRRRRDRGVAAAVLGGNALRGRGAGTGGGDAGMSATARREIGVGVIGFQDLVTIEDHGFCTAVAEGGQAEAAA